MLTRIIKVITKILAGLEIMGFFLPIFLPEESKQVSLFTIMIGEAVAGDRVISAQYWLVILLIIPALVLLLPFSKRHKERGTELIDLAGTLFGFDLLLVFLFMKGEGSFLAGAFERTTLFYGLFAIYGVSLILLIYLFGRRNPKNEAQGEIVKRSEYETKFCHECGKKIPKFSKFCPYCGEKLRDVESVE